MDIGCSSTVLMERIVEKLRPGKDAVMKWHTQAGNITTNIKVQIYFTLPALSLKNVVTWKCCVYEWSKGRYDRILGQDLLIKLGINLKLS